MGPGWPVDRKTRDLKTMRMGERTRTEKVVKEILDVLTKDAQSPRISELCEFDRKKVFGSEPVVAPEASRACQAPSVVGPPGSFGLRNQCPLWWL